MKLTSISRGYYSVQRLREIIRVLVKYGFGYIVGRLHLDQRVLGRGLLKIGVVKRAAGTPEAVEVRLRKALEELGPTFIKFGQMLSSRPDLVHLKFCHEFTKLQDEVPPFDYRDVEKKISECFGAYPGELFSSFSREPMAAASLGQVHRATLKSGEEVVVKVQRPGIRETILADVNILHFLAGLAERHIEEARAYDLTGMVEEFSKAIKKEIDFTTEARNVERFRKNFKDDEGVRIPAVFWKYTSAFVITLEELKGVKLKELLEKDTGDFDRKLIAARGADAILKQIFVDGFFHADPHPGNIFILDGNVVGLVDFGMIGRLDLRTMENLADLLVSVIGRDIDGIMSSLAALGMVGEQADSREIRLDAFDLLDSYYGVPLDQIEMGKLLGELVEMLVSHRMRIPRELYLLTRALVTIEGSGRRLDPDFDMISHTRPFAVNLIRKKYSPDRILGDLRKAARSSLSFAMEFPGDMASLIRMAGAGKLNIGFQHKGLSEFIREMDRSSNRITFGVVVAALIVGSSLIMLSGRGSTFLGFPLLGIAGFTIAAFMGFWLLIAILRSGKL